MDLQATFRRAALALLAGALSGTAASLFLRALDLVTHLRFANPGLIYALPVFGLLVGGLYERFGTRASRGLDLILDEIHRPVLRTPGRMTPLVFSASLLSHLGGASTGREGAVVQMGASLADQISRFWELSPADRKLLLMAGSAGGFAAALGAPIAGMVFGMEVLTNKLRFRIEYPIECALASATAFAMTILFRVPHTHYGEIPLVFPHASSWISALATALLLGFAIGAAVRIFFLATEGCSEIFRINFRSAGARAFIGGCILLALVGLLHHRLALGLGIESIQSSFETASPVLLPFEKILFTAVSLGAGFKGGEFVPLLFIGATLASSLAPLFSLFGLALTPAFAAGCGMSAAYGAAARVPLALAVFAAEKFSWSFFPFAFVATLGALFVTGRHTRLFPAQR